MNFLDIQSGAKDRSNTWRNILAMGMFVVALGGIGWSFASSFSSGKISTFIARVTPDGFPLAEDKEVVKAGGDITVEPMNLPVPPKLIGELVPASTFAAEGLIVKDVETGALLYEKRAYEQRPIASITKLMSALVILEKSPDWTTSTIVVSDTVPDTHMYAGDTYTLEELWRAALVGSSNKAKRASLACSIVCLQIRVDLMLGMFQRHQIWSFS
ncbi:MAG: D-alanyl-D-alanine endopeptidase [Candidatus Magasanikbacteria bacterium GW2011_GWE2_42_7]|uniref:D-alanyl-D-alanine endopeptidase n=1 Tax=Candidatus Magasanikbacteria bacterium GW2011_GWE2_42_7 TaxID=1619052 RepID=A0A0G1BCQ7_9BACT|nr:MAG: D-alanyl-D-alanine endopeptidase [Candidatus Magasanikbacteria bacterium GW2011_GWE2_42_7]